MSHLLGYRRLPNEDQCIYYKLYSVEDYRWHQIAKSILTAKSIVHEIFIWIFNGHGLQRFIYIFIGLFILQILFCDLQLYYDSNWYLSS